MGKRLMAALCSVILLMTIPGMTVPAKESINGEIIMPEMADDVSAQAEMIEADTPDVEVIPENHASATERIPENHATATEGIPENYTLATEGIPENNASATERIPENHALATEAIPENYASATEVIPEDYASDTEVIPENDAPATEIIPENYVSDDSETETQEEAVGEGDLQTFTVGNNVKAIVAKEGGQYVLYFDSNGGTLWKDWRSKLGGMAALIEIIKFTEDSTKMFLPKDSSFLFCGDKNKTSAGLTKIRQIDLEKADTSDVTNMSNMFDGCESLTNLDLSSFDTSNVTDMSYMFTFCRRLPELDVRGFDTGKVTDMSSMFDDCQSLKKIDVSRFDTSKVTSMRAMFANCATFRELDLRNFNTANVTDMSLMFYLCGEITDLDLRSFDTENVMYIHDMFGECWLLTNLDLSSFDISGCSEDNCRYAFASCHWLAALKTPKKTRCRIDLPITMYDGLGNEYTSLPFEGPESSKSILLTNIRPTGVIDLADCTIALSETSYTYDGKTKEPAVTVKYGRKELKPDTDYTVAYINNRNAGKAAVKLTGKGLYKGEKSVEFDIKKAAPKLTFSKSVISKKVFDGQFTNKLTKTTDGTVTFSSGNKSVASVNSSSGLVIIKGAGTTVITASAAAGKNYAAGTAEYLLTVIDPRIDISSGTAATRYKIYEYTGKIRQPALILKVGGRTLVKGKDYTLSYRNNRKVGTGTVTATGMGNYKGTKSCTFKIKELVPVYRLFNTGTGEHFYTKSSTERQNYLKAGNWKSEGIAWYAPKKSSQPIYRLSNPNNGNEHHYTKTGSEKDWLVSIGWHYDGIAWYSDTDSAIPIYRHYHPIQRTGNHHYTTSKGESDHIVRYEGWNYEGVAFYVSRAGG